MRGDHRLATQMATIAGRVLHTLRAKSTLAGAPLGAAGDAVAHALIAGMLEAQRPGDGLLSEEHVPDERRLDMHRVRIVDPLDGTASTPTRPSAGTTGRCMWP